MGWPLTQPATGMFPAAANSRIVLGENIVQVWASLLQSIKGGILVLPASIVVFLIPPPD
jgi:hypothetical protein